MIDGSAPFKSPPRCTRATFTRVLTDAGSPWAAAAPALYDLIVSKQHDPSVWLAIAGRESTYGTNHDSVLWRNQTNSWTNARTVRDPGVKPRATIITDPVRKSQYVKYATVSDSLLDGMFRVDEPGYAYQQAHAVSIAQVLAIWTEAESAEYTAYVVNKMNEWSVDMPTPQRPPHIALSAGHHNTSGGDAHEIEQTGPLTAALAAACRARGMDVRVVQGNDGRDMFPGGLRDVARKVVAWDAAGWPVDIYLETHTEGAGGARGMFAIYPDWDGDVDTDVRDKLGPDIVARVTQATGLGKRGNGLMSEKQTGVGAGGDRLGIFLVTADIKDHATRLIVEFGAHDNAQDLAIVDAPGFGGKAGAAVAAAFAAFLGWQSDASGGGSTDPVPDVTPSTNDAVTFAEVPYRIVLGFKGFWEQINPGLRLYLLGFPTGNERAVTTIPGVASAQPFERGWLVYQPNDNPTITVATRGLQHALEQEFLAEEAA